MDPVRGRAPQVGGRDRARPRLVLAERYDLTASRSSPAARAASGGDRVCASGGRWESSRTPHRRPGSPRLPSHSPGVDGSSALEASADILSANRVRLESRHRRLPMGSGTFAIAEFVSAINSLGYRGVISAEVLSTTFREREPSRVRARSWTRFARTGRSADPVASRRNHKLDRRSGKLTSVRGP